MGMNTYILGMTNRSGTPPPEVWCAHKHLLCAVIAGLWLGSLNGSDGCWSPRLWFFCFVDVSAESVLQCLAVFTGWLTSWHSTPA